MIETPHYLAFSFILYMIGIYCLVTKRNMIRLLLGIEILINAANFNFISLARSIPSLIDPLALSIVTVSIGLAASVSAVAVIIIVYAYRHYGTLDVRLLKRLKG
ncbi:MAG: NADH-quinone oxidoreductase subunit NuoK [Candidatus Methanomethyliaceae archaeon]|nr:NADH-quinone oxidoreductase subunit NuoK [Candidatus Methanomethyliaceae archaeon]